MIKAMMIALALFAAGPATIHQFKVPSIEGQTIDFSKFKGKKVLIVNTASKCGYTPQYAELEQLHKAYGSKLVIVGFPANNFGGQEPGSNAEINDFCQKNYGVSFVMAEKVSVKGTDIHPLFKWLTSKEENGVMDAEIKWNFTKFLLDEKGKLLAVFPSKVKPMGEEITTYLK
ncbi:MAG: glutathione peroxidase [Chitinophagaceae bacterium]|jgi:glutathione peroxidase|nr:glutathione peroxidase [Chitinophagaceae bacterium]